MRQRKYDESEWVGGALSEPILIMYINGVTISDIANFNMISVVLVNQIIDRYAPFLGE
jgi:hypothetical protein